MIQSEAINVFEQFNIRSLWNDEVEKWYFFIVDVVAVLTESPNALKYWRVLKTRLKKEGSELTTNCSQLKMTASDGFQVSRLQRYRFVYRKGLKENYAMDL